MADIPRDKHGQMDPVKPWHYELLNLLEDMCSPSEDAGKTLTAYMPEIIEIVEKGLHETSA